MRFSLIIKNFFQLVFGLKTLQKDLKSMQCLIKHCYYNFFQGNVVDVFIYLLGFCL